MKKNLTLFIAIIVCYLLSYFSEYKLSVFLTIVATVFFLYQLIKKVVEYNNVKRGIKYDGRITNVTTIDRDDDGNDRIATIEYEIGSKTFEIEHRYSHIVKSEPRDLRVYVNPVRPDKPILMEDFYKQAISGIFSSIVFIVLAFLITFLKR